MKELKSFRFVNKKSPKGNKYTLVFTGGNGKTDVLGNSIDGDTLLGILPSKVTSKTFKKLGITKVQFKIVKGTERTDDRGTTGQLFVKKHDGE